MKICRKCRIEYKDDYIFCPRCGTPYDKKNKKVKVSGEISDSIMDMIKKILNIFLYILGCLLILGYITTITENPGGSILGILFGLSLFQVFYKMAKNMFNNIDEKKLKIVRIALPLIILLVWMIFFSETTNENDINSNIEQNSGFIEENKEDETKEKETTSYDLEIDIKELTEYYYEYGYKQGNITYFGKKVKTSATFNSSDSSWPESVYMDIPSGAHYQISCNSFKSDTFKKMSSKKVGENISFIGKVDELISSNGYKSGILTFDDCEILE